MKWLSEWIETLRVAPPFSRRRRELLAAIREFEGVEVSRPLSDVAPICDHEGITHGPFSYTWVCPGCGLCKFIGHGPLCTDCLYASVPSERMDP